MERLGNNVWLGITNAIYTIHSAEDARQMAEVFMNQIKWLIPFDRSMFFIKGSVDSEDDIPICINISDEDARLFCSDMSRYDSTLGLKVGGSSMLYKESDVVDMEIFKQSCFYNEFCKPNHIEYILHMVICYNNEYLGNMLLFRNDNMINAIEFSDKDFFVLSLFKEHLAVGLHRLYAENNMANITKIDKRVIYEDRHLVPQSLDDIFRGYGLTSREKEILELLMDGVDNYYISDSLSISPNTLKKHTFNIYRKLGINSRTELMRMIKVATSVEKNVIA